MIEEELPDELENDLDDIEPVGDESQLYEHFRVVVDKGQAMVRVDKYLFERIVNASRNRIQKAAEDGFVMANGKPVKSSYKVKPLDVITVMMDRPRYENEVIPEDIPLDIVYEDKYLMVVNKPAGLVVHPGHGNYRGTLVNAIAWHMKDIPDYDANDPHVGLVHRIDKDTSGLLVVAKKPEAKAHLSMQFFHKTTKREYRALVWGIVREDEGRIEGNIGRNPRDRMQMTVFPEGDQGKTAVTHYSVLERLGYVTLVNAKRDENGQVSHVLYTTRLISDTKHREQNWIVIAEAANKANKAKTDFLSRMAHDIRTPMNAIMGFTSIAQNQLDNTERLKDTLRKIQISGRYLQQIADDVLDISRIESGSLKLDNVDTSITRLFQDTADTAREIQPEKHLQFFCDAHDIAYEHVLGDPLHLQQIYMNLLSNAVKYTPEGGEIHFEIYQELLPHNHQLNLISIIRACRRNL